MESDQEEYGPTHIQPKEYLRNNKMAVKRQERLSQDGYMKESCSAWKMKEEQGEWFSKKKQKKNITFAYYSFQMEGLKNGKLDFTFVGNSRITLLCAQNGNVKRLQDSLQSSL